MTFKDYLEIEYACLESLEWVGERTLEQAWAECERGDWMLWLAEKLPVDRKLIALAACDCMQTTWKYCDKETLAAVKHCDHVIREWCEDRASVADVRAARAGVANAKETKAATCAAIAAYAAAVYVYTGESSYTAADAAADAADAYAIDAEAADDAQKAAHMECASLIRARIPAALLVLPTTPQEEE